MPEIQTKHEAIINWCPLCPVHAFDEVTSCTTHSVLGDLYLLDLAGSFPKSMHASPLLCTGTGSGLQV